MCYAFYDSPPVISVDQPERLTGSMSKGTLKLTDRQADKFRTVPTQPPSIQLEPIRPQIHIGLLWKMSISVCFSVFTEILLSQW